MKRANNNCDLKSCFLCKGCLPDWLPAIEAHKKNESFKKGTIIFEEGDAVKGLYFLFKGRVKVHKRWGQDKQLILHFAKEGDMLGYRGLGKEKVYPVTATALEEAVVCFIDIPFFESTLQVNHQLTYDLMQFYANELQDAEKRMRDLAHMEVKGRIAETLLMLKENFGQDKAGDINISLTKQDLASYAGTTYETFFRMANELVKEKMIKISGKNIAILKETKLKELTYK
jgi:CRP-like cAMP-binding protein